MRRRPDVVIAVAIAVASVVLRAPLLSRPLWKDERITLSFIRRFSVPELITVIPVRQPHYPTYYVLLDALAWLPGFDAAAAGRALAVLASSATPVVVYWWGRERWDRRRALAVATLVGLSPVVIAQGYWARMYGPLLLSITASYWLAWRLLAREGRGMWYALAAITAALLHPFGAVAAGVQAAWVGVERWVRDRELEPAVPAVVAVVLASGSVTVGRLLMLRSNYGREPLHVAEASRPVLRAVVLPVASLTGTVYLDARLITVVVAAVGIGVLYIRDRQYRTLIGRAAAVWVAGSVVVLAVLSRVSPVLMLKYVAWLAPGVALAVGNSRWEGVGRWALVGGLLGLIVLGDVLLFLEHRPVARVAIDGVGVLRRIR